MMLRILLAMTFAVAVWSVPASRAEVLQIPAEFWAPARHGDAVTQLPGLAGQVLQLRQGKSVLVIRHGGGEENVARATELAAWLTALGVSSAQLRIELGATDTSRLDTELEQGR